jgi:cell wall-associated NlpC family hydrolase
MNKTIKTRDVVKDIKVLDRRAGLGAVRGVHAKAKEVAERDEGPGQQHRHGVDYAQDKAEQAAKATGRGAVKGAGKAVGAVRKVSRLAKDVRQEAQEARRVTEAVRKQAEAAHRQEAVAHRQAPRTAGQAAQKASSRAATASGQAAQATGRQAVPGAANTTRTTNTARAATRVAGQTTAKTTRASAKTAVKVPARTVKASAKTVKTAKVAGGRAIKTSRQTARTAKAAAKATQVAARSAARAARAAARATAQAAKAAVRGIAAFVRMVIAAVQSLISAIAAGGWVAVVVILIICLVAFVATSAFGIFFAGGDMGDENPSLREVVAEINQEYADEIARTEDENPHDDLIVTGTRAPWQEVLALYAVRATTDPDDPLDAITLDERRQRMLREVFWDMNAIEARTEDREVTETIAVEQEDGTITEETETHIRRTLYLTQSARTIDETAVLYGFSAEQSGLLAELLSPEYASAWQAVLYGIHSGAGDIVEVAASQIGNAGGAPYWSWYGFSGRVEWCACFVSWCAAETGYLDAGRIPRFSYCPSGIAWFQDAGQWQDRGYMPQPGDIIFFDWQGDGESDHVGIVEYVESGYVHTIEGNSSDTVNRQTYSISSSVIVGYGLITQ